MPRKSRVQTLNRSRRNRGRQSTGRPVRTLAALSNLIADGAIGILGTVAWAVWRTRYAAVAVRTSVRLPTYACRSYRNCADSVQLPQRVTARRIVTLNRTSPGTHQLSLRQFTVLRFRSIITPRAHANVAVHPRDRVGSEVHATRQPMAEPGQLDKGQSRWVWPFELTEQIGEGGMGVVYRARYTTPIPPSPICSVNSNGQIQRDCPLSS